MSSLKDKIYNYEVTPPAKAWDKIVIDLDEAELTNKFSDRLYNMEATPPASAWEKVNASLNPAGDSVAIPLLKRITPFLRYAAAAIFIGAIAFGIIKFTTGNGNTIDTAVEIFATKDSIEPGKDKPASTIETQTATNNNNDDDLALEQSKKMLARLDTRIKRITGKLSGYAAGVKSNAIANPDTELSQSIYAYEDHVPNLADRYVMLMTPDGNIIRMSKKWSDLLCCVSGEEQDADCKDQLKKWQQKMATSSLAPSPGNFMDILGLVNSLNEGTEL